MDPDQALAELRELLDGTEDEALTQVAEVFGALDEWLSKGGYLPAEWQRHQPTHEWMRGQPAHNPSRGVFGADKWGRTPR